MVRLDVETILIRGFVGDDGLRLEVVCVNSSPVESSIVLILPSENGRGEGRCRNWGGEGKEEWVEIEELHSNNVWVGIPLSLDGKD